MSYTLCTKNLRCGKLDGHEGECSGEPHPAEPTTAEAFDTLRRALAGGYSKVPPKYADALALLERRMQEMRGIASELRPLATHDQACDRDGYGKSPDTKNCAACAWDALPST